MSAITEIPAKTPKPMGRTWIDFPGITNGAGLEAAADEDALSAAEVPPPVVGVPVDDASFAEARPAALDVLATVELATEVASDEAEVDAAELETSLAAVAVDTAEKVTELAP